MMVDDDNHTIKEREATMDPHGKFLPPKTDEEFKERIKDLTLESISAMLDSLKHRRAALVESIDAEISFYEKAHSQKLSELPF